MSNIAAKLVIIYKIRNKFSTIRCRKRKKKKSQPKYKLFLKRKKKDHRSTKKRGKL